MSFDEFDDWEETPEEEEEVKIEEAQWEKDDPDTVIPGSNVALLGFQWAGKSLLATLFGYLNLEYADQFDAQENFPRVYQMLKDGTLPEVEEFHIIDLDGSYKKRSHKEDFGTLAKPLYKAGKIDRTTIKIPSVQHDTVNQAVSTASLVRIDSTKLKIENAITREVADNGPEVALAIDSMSSYDELLNKKFNILYEGVIADTPKQHVGAAMKGIRQNYWKIRNGWWRETLRDKRTYEGWQLDIYKVEEKHGKYLKLEIEDAKKLDYKDPSEVKTYKIEWPPKTEYDLDAVWFIRNDGKKYWVEAAERGEGSAKDRAVKHHVAEYTPKRAYAVWEILEELANNYEGTIDNPEDIFKI